MNTAPKKIVKKVREKLLLTIEQKQQWAACYHATGKLPQINIPCSKCNMGITAGHENLRKKIAKHGSIEQLLSNFICKDCSDKPIKQLEKVVDIKSVKTSKRDVIERDHSGRFVIPRVNMHRDNIVYSIADIAKSSSLTYEFTNGSCMQPHLYLNSDRTCDACPLYSNCACSVKTLSRVMRRKLDAQESQHYIA